VLRALTIQDLAIVHHLDLEFESGLTVITGETGAGKSILVDALGLVLGDRADSSQVRIGAERAAITAVFDVRGRNDLCDYLQNHDLKGDEELLVRRVIGADGRSRAFCNETPVTVQVLREVAAQLIDIHGQHEHHSLLQRPVQRMLLDDFGQLYAEVAAVRDAFHCWQEAADALRALVGDTGDVGARLDFLRFQIDELASARIDGDTIARLEQDHRRLAHGHRLRAACDDIAQRLFGGERSALRFATGAHHVIRELQAIDPALGGIAELTDQAVINLVEAERELTRYRQQLGGEQPQALEQIETRLGQLHDLARKHRCDPAALPQVLERLNDELTELEQRDRRRDDIEARLASARSDYDRCAAALSEARRMRTGPLAARVTGTLHQLGMPHARFEIALAPTGEPTATGSDDVEFLVTTNPDHPARPLRRVASGGELSRISLALQVATAGTANVPTLIYDEVDTGIGGRTANVVARHLNTLAANRQVLCITHLAQVASAGAHHLLITKSVEDGTTTTAAHYLSASARVDEIARMLGGEHPTARSRAHARELLAG
jgi:DNA repair protein RecN (Recombination protein N)